VGEPIEHLLVLRVGRFGGGDDREPLLHVGDLRAEEMSKSVPHFSPWLFLAVVFFLTAEWLLRKRGGLA
jgi:hypothetical protein